VTLSYIIPFLPADAHFIGLPFIQLGIDQVTQAEVEDKLFLINVMQNLYLKKSLYSLSLSPNDKVDMKTFNILKYFGFRKNQCKLFRSNIGQSFELCEISKM
jgi:hypothetical protein